MENANRTPWHLWVIGVLALIWNFGGIFDYLMTQFRADWYLEQFTPDQLEYFTEFDTLFTTFWALGVWGAFIGSILLLARSRFAFHAFVVALVGIAVTFTITVSSPMPASLNTTGVWIFNAAIIVATILLAWYARRMSARGVLR